MSKQPSQSRIKGHIDVVSKVTGLLPREIRSNSKDPATVRARWRVWKALRDEGFGYLPIARAWPCDHTTVMYGMRRLEELGG